MTCASVACALFLLVGCMQMPTDGSTAYGGGTVTYGVNAEGQTTSAAQNQSGANDTSGASEGNTQGNGQVAGAKTSQSTSMTSGAAALVTPSPTPDPLAWASAQFQREPGDSVIEGSVSGWTNYSCPSRNNTYQMVIELDLGSSKTPYDPHDIYINILRSDGYGQTAENGNSADSSVPPPGVSTPIGLFSQQNRAALGAYTYARVGEKVQFALRVPCPRPKPNGQMPAITQTVNVQASSVGQSASLSIVN